MKYKPKIILVLTLAIFLAGCQSYTTLQENDMNYPSINPTPKGAQVHIHLFYPEKESDILVKEVRIVNLENKNLETVVVNELLKGTNKNELRNIIPDGVKMLSIYTQDSIAYVNFNSALTKEKLGENEEALIIYSIVNSLTSIENIDKVQILIEGERRENFNRYKLNEPIEFSSLIVELPYISPIITVEEYYDALTMGNYKKLFEMESMQHKNEIRYSNYKLYYQFENMGLINCEITDYEIIKYDNETILLYDVNMYYPDDRIIKTGWKEINLKYDNYRFIIENI